MKTINSIYYHTNKSIRKVIITGTLLICLITFPDYAKAEAQQIWEKKPSFFTSLEKSSRKTQGSFPGTKGEKGSQQSVFSLKTRDAFFDKDEEPSLSAPPPGATEDDAQKIQAPMNAKEYAVFLVLGVSMVLVYGRKGRKGKA
ncbi:MAG: hypothetical protein LUG18_02515 [Candidatus Azobacteroides sp.]|nr:hypothetical protein [Candidatus Azobacteroides sp.]